MPSTLPSTRVLVAVGILGLVCTAVAFLLFFALIGEVGPVRATVITYFNPAVALVLGIVLLHEPLTFGAGVGFVLILLGSFLATRSGPRAAGVGSGLAGATSGTPRPGNRQASCRRAPQPFRAETIFETMCVRIWPWETRGVRYRAPAAHRVARSSSRNCAIVVLTGEAASVARTWGMPCS